MRTEINPARGPQFRAEEEMRFINKMTTVRILKELVKAASRCLPSDRVIELWSRSEAGSNYLNSYHRDVLTLHRDGLRHEKLWHELNVDGLPFEPTDEVRDSRRVRPSRLVVWKYRLRKADLEDYLGRLKQGWDGEYRMQPVAEYFFDSRTGETIRLY